MKWRNSSCLTCVKQDKLISLPKCKHWQHAFQGFAWIYGYIQCFLFESLVNLPLLLHAPNWLSERKRGFSTINQVGRYHYTSEYMHYVGAEGAGVVPPPAAIHLAADVHTQRCELLINTRAHTSCMLSDTNLNENTYINVFLVFTYNDNQHPCHANKLKHNIQIYKGLASKIFRVK
jgi:hypothetical protein